MNVSTGEKLKNLRLMNNMTQKDLSGKLPASLSVICDIENNRRSPSKNMSLKLAKYFNTTTDYWFEISEEINKKEKFFYLQTSINRLLENKLYKNGVAEDGIWEEIIMCLKIDVATIIKEEEKEVI